MEKQNTLLKTDEEMIRFTRPMRKNKVFIEKEAMKYRALTKDAKHTQKWKEYNEAQTKEKLIFYRLLDELLEIIPERTYTFGRPRKSLRDMVFCCMIKIYVNTSSRRTISDLELAKRAGYITDVPHFNTLLNYFEDIAVKIILRYLINVSALPLKNVEERFAVDATGFGTKRFDRWIDAKYGKKQPIVKYRKCHAICGVRTNIITSVETTKGNFGDSRMFKHLVTRTAEEFLVTEVSADKAYSSRANLDLVNSLGALPFIPFKSNATGNQKGSPTWKNMYQMFTENYRHFAEHYHKRSNIETCFAMIKRKFGDYCRCKSPQSQDNEILCKVLCHNIVVLIHEMFELKIDIDFKEISKQKEFPAQKVI